MLTVEEDRVLATLRRCSLMTMDALTRSCAAPAASVDRILSHLEWVGLVVVYRDRAGRAEGVELKVRTAGG